MIALGSIVIVKQVGRKVQGLLHVLAFGAQRDFQIKNEASGKVETILHK
eukprot:SAG31_NODE_5456_length_2526_cov_1.722291_1_plen_48_part_10